MDNSRNPLHDYEPTLPPASAKAARSNPRSIEYVFRAVVLLTAAASLIILLIIIVNDNNNFSGLSFPTACLVVALPILAGLSWDLKMAEMRNPRLAFEPLKRRSTQFTKLAAFVTCFFSLIAWVYGILQQSSNPSASLGKLTIDVLIILVVAGGILAYETIAG